jgi:hypothetical protein
MDAFHLADYFEYVYIIFTYSHAIIFRLFRKIKRLQQAATTAA